MGRKNYYELCDFMLGIGFKIQEWDEYLVEQSYYLNGQTQSKLKVSFKIIYLMEKRSQIYGLVYG